MIKIVLQKFTRVILLSDARVAQTRVAQTRVAQTRVAQTRVAQTPECADEHLHHFAFAAGLSTEKGNAHASLRGVECSGSAEVGTSNDIWGASGARVVLCRGTRSFVKV